MTLFDPASVAKAIVFIGDASIDLKQVLPLRAAREPCRGGSRTALQRFAVVLGVTRIAPGLQVILHGLSMIGVFVVRAN
jgi:hypothetical protein